MTDNLFAALGTLGTGATMAVTRGTDAYSAWLGTIDRNRYQRDTGETRPYFFRAAESALDNTLSAWQTATGFDPNSAIVSGLPASAEAVATPSRYTVGRGQLHVWNFNGASSVSVDLGPILAGLNGFPFAIYHAFDYVTGGSPVTTGTYTGTLVTVPKNARTPPTPYGASAPPTLPNTFGVFVVTQRPGYTVSYSGGL